MPHYTHESFTITGPKHTPYRFRHNGKELQVMNGLIDSKHEYVWHHATEANVPKEILEKAKKHILNSKIIYR